MNRLVSWILVLGFGIGLGLLAYLGATRFQQDENGKPPSDVGGRVEVATSSGAQYGFENREAQKRFDTLIATAKDPEHARAHLQKLKKEGKCRPWLLFETADSAPPKDPDLAPLELPREMELDEFRILSARLRAIRTTLVAIRAIAREERYTPLWESLSKDLGKPFAPSDPVQYLAWVQAVGRFGGDTPHPFGSDPFVAEDPRPPFLIAADRATVRATLQLLLGNQDGPEDGRAAGQAMAARLGVDPRKPVRDRVAVVVSTNTVKKLKEMNVDSRDAVGEKLSQESDRDRNHKLHDALRDQAIPTLAGTKPAGP